MGFTSNHSFTFGQTQVSFTQETLCFSLASPEKTVGCLAFPTLWIVNSVLVSCALYELQDPPLCVFLLHSLTKALHCGTSQHLFSVGTKGIAAAAAAFPTSPNWPQHNQIRLAVFSYLSEGGHQVQTL